MGAIIGTPVIDKTEVFEVCNLCGKQVKMQVQKGTGYCSAKCAQHETDGAGLPSNGLYMYVTRAERDRLMEERV